MSPARAAGADERVAPVPSRIDFRDYYAGCGGSPLFRWLDRRKVRILRTIVQRLPDASPPRVLDLGCGTGSVVGQALRGRRALAVGIDINPGLLRQAAQRAVKGVQGCFEEALPFGDDAFDIVVMVDTLEHVTSRERVVNEAKRVLKPDGYLVIFTPPYDSPLWNIGEQILWAVKAHAGSDHISPFTRESLTWLLASNFRSHEVGKLNFNLTMYGFGRQKLVGAATGRCHG